MRRIAFLLVTVLLAAVLLAGGTGTATAEPQKNQIKVRVSCDNDPEPEYTLVFNAMSKTGQVLGSTSNVVVKSGTVTYFDPVTGGLKGSDEIGGQGNKKNLRGDRITCEGETTTEIQGLGRVRAVFEFEGFVTPRGR